MASPIAMLSIPPFFATSIPDFASYMTMQSEGFKPNISAAFKNTSGSGFVFIILFPSEIASKYAIALRCSKICFAFLPEEPIVSLYPLFLTSNKVLFTSFRKSAFLNCTSVNRICPLAYSQRVTVSLYGEQFRSLEG